MSTEQPATTGASSSATPRTEAGASTDAPGPTGGSVPTGTPTPAGASTTADATTEAGARMDEAGASADPPPGPFLEADSPSVAGRSEAGAPVEAGGRQAGATRPVPATDVQVHPVIPLPRPYAAPATVEESIPVPPGGPYPPGGPHPPVAPPVAGRRPLSRALWVGVILAGAVLMGAGFLLVYGGFAGGAKHPAPCGGKSCAPPVRQPAPPGAQIAYRTVERDAGYFEGTVTIANQGAQPMRSWSLSFRYPGANIHNTWDAVLQRQGEDTTLTGTATARPIAPGATLEVRFGGSGTPSMPTDCRLNGTPCAFVAR
ncbi:cellulose binding domain-containing protein [Actinoallomurus sp. CA-150999]|uniref:cellulose binding domain-containing protein n=1 Tax=Actinoallomurus sp. CA-150999 TaxID=3239887 RepID=UPI003D8BABE7